MADPWPRLGRIYITIELARDEDHELLPRGSDRREAAFWAGFRIRYPKLKPRPLITSVSRERVDWLHARARARDRRYATQYGDKNLNRVYALAFDSSHDFQPDLGRLERDARDPNSPIVAVRVVVAGRDPGKCDVGTLQAGQIYRSKAPEGVDAEAVENTAGADGAGVRFADIERGWTPDHEDLDKHDIPDDPLHGTLEDASRQHGTSVLGIVAAVDNEIFCVGIAPAPDEIYLASREPSGVPDAILAVLGAEDGTYDGEPYLRPGDVLLLEVQDEDHASDPGKAFNVPVETGVDTFDAIRLATANDVTVVEVAGNGYIGEYDKPRNLDLHPRLDPDHGDFEDSLAILVAAGIRDGQDANGDLCWARRPSSNYGKRVNCFAQGKDVHTLYSSTSGAKDLCRHNFAATSAAAAIVAGVAVSVQGMAKELGLYLSAATLRSILSEPDLGTLPCEAVREDTPMGTMPDLARILELLQKMAGEDNVPIEDPLPDEGGTVVIEDPDEETPGGGSGEDDSEPPETDDLPTIMANGTSKANVLVQRLRGEKTPKGPWPRKPYLITGKLRRKR